MYYYSHLIKKEAGSERSDALLKVTQHVLFCNVYVCVCMCALMCMCVCVCVHSCMCVCVCTMCMCAQCVCVHSIMPDSLQTRGVSHGPPPGSSVHGISQARILQWVATSISICATRLPYFFFFPSLSLKINPQQFLSSTLRAPLPQLPC